MVVVGFLGVGFDCLRASGWVCLLVFSVVFGWGVGWGLVVGGGVWGGWVGGAVGWGGGVGLFLSFFGVGHCCLCVFGGLGCVVGGSFFVMVFGWGFVFVLWGVLGGCWYLFCGLLGFVFGWGLLGGYAYWGFLGGCFWGFLGVIFLCVVFVVYWVLVVLIFFGGVLGFSWLLGVLGWGLWGLWGVGISVFWGGGVLCFGF